MGKQKETKKKEKIEFRYCEFPPEFPLIALLGKDWEVPYGRDAMHFHNYLEIGYCYYGTGKMVFGVEEIPYDGGSVAVIPKNFPHHTVGSDEQIQKWEYLYVDCEKFLAECFDRQVIVNRLMQRLQSRVFVVTKTDHPEIMVLVRMILEEMRCKKEFYQESVQAKLLALLLELVRVNPSDIPAGMEWQEQSNLEYIMDVLEYVETHYGEDIRLEQMVQVSRMSETHFRRKFTEYMHATPMEYVNLVRIEKACELLSKTDEKLTDIAMQTGFQTNSAFIRNFKKIIGMLPKDWRKETRGRTDDPISISDSPVLR